MGLSLTAMPRDSTTTWALVVASSA